MSALEQALSAPAIEVVAKTTLARSIEDPALRLAHEGAFA